MLKLIISFAITFTMTEVAQAQSPYITTPDANHAGGIIYNGIISKYALINQPAFIWYNTNQSSYTAPTMVVEAMKAATPTIKYLVFGGTWCEDTQNVLPKFFKLQEQSGVPDTDISFVGVDREKHSVGNLAQAHGITNVPTIIVMKDGKEVGRVVEYGKTGKWDEELAALLKTP